MLGNLRKEIVAALEDAEAEIAAMGGSVTGKSAVMAYTSKSKSTAKPPSRSGSVSSKAGSVRGSVAGSDAGSVAGSARGGGARSVTPALSVVSEER